MSVLDAAAVEGLADRFGVTAGRRSLKEAYDKLQQAVWDEVRARQALRIEEDAYEQMLRLGENEMRARFETSGNKVVYREPNPAYDSELALWEQYEQDGNAFGGAVPRRPSQYVERVVSAAERESIIRDALARSAGLEDAKANVAVAKRLYEEAQALVEAARTGWRTGHADLLAGVALLQTVSTRDSEFVSWR